MNQRILIADDHSILRDGIRALVSRMKNMKVVGEAVNGNEAISKFNQLKPDLLILDISMPDRSGMEVAREIIESNPDAKIIILSMYDDENYINRCIESGVKGYVIKNESGSELETAIQTVLDGRNYFSSQVQKVIFERHTRQLSHTKQREEVIRLTQREIEIIKLVAEGLTSQEMADKLFISSRTVETHRSNLMKKMGVKNSIELIRKAQQIQII